MSIAEILRAAAVALKKRGTGPLANRFERFVHSQAKDEDLEQRVWDRISDELIGEDYVGETMGTLMGRLTKTQLIAKIEKAARRRPKR